MSNSFMLKFQKSRKNVRIGSEYQADSIPIMDKENYKAVEEDLLLWEPTGELSEKEIDDFIVKATDEHNYSKDQAYGLLSWHQLDSAKAKEDLSKYIPQPDLWSHEEKEVFEQGLVIYGKDFDEIKKLLPDKSIKQIVHYYFHRSRHGLGDKKKRLRI